MADFTAGKLDGLAERLQNVRVGRRCLGLPASPGAIRLRRDRFVPHLFVEFCYVITYRSVIPAEPLF